MCHFALRVLAVAAACVMAASVVTSCGGDDDVNSEPVAPPSTDSDDDTDNDAPADDRTDDPRQTLNGAWEFRFDDADEGELVGWFAPDAAWPQSTIDIPSTWNAVFPERLWYQGPAWYRRDFDVPATWPDGGRIFVRFGGAALRARVWLNGVELGEHLFGFTPFEFDLTDHLHPNGNRLVVRVDNAILDRAIPDAEWDGWWNWGGIYRDVTLIRRPDVHLANMWMDTRMSGDAWSASIHAIVRNSRPSRVAATLEVALADATGPVWSRIVPASLGRGETAIALEAAFGDVATWSPDSPTLYTLTATLKELPSGPQREKIRHTRNVRTGFRQIETDRGRILLNGEPLRIRGVNYHEEYPGVGNAVPMERVREDLKTMRELGVNMVRLAHYPQADHVYDLCDEMGFLVWDEIPAWQTSAATLGDEEVLETWAKPQLAEMIDAHRAHPSVVFWSVANEIPTETYRAGWYVENTTAFVRAMDPTRLVTYASDRQRLPLAVLNLERGFPFVDVIAINEYYGWYYGDVDDVGGVLDAWHERYPDKPILVSEFGAEAVYGWSDDSPTPDKYSEDYQIHLLSTHLAQIYAPGRTDYVAGGIIWVFADFPDPHRIGDGHPPEYNYLNTKGLVTRDRIRKRSFDVVREFFEGLL